MEKIENNKINISAIEKFSTARWERIRGELETISGLDSPSGVENSVRNYILDRAEKLGIKTKVDKAGNLWLLSDSPEGEILLNAHLDKIGNGSMAKSGEGEVIGRLDDSLGISVILGLMKEGLRPSAVFTVEEELEKETVNGKKEIKIVQRDLGESGYNFGARTAVEEIVDGQFKKPKITVVVDVSKKGKLGGGPLIYTAPMNFRFPKEGLKFVNKLLLSGEIHAQFIEGAGNDSIEFSFLQQSGTLAIEIPIENFHTVNEKARISDINEASKLLSLIITHHDKIPEIKDIPMHARPKRGKPINS